MARSSWQAEPWPHPSTALRRAFPVLDVARRVERRDAAVEHTRLGLLALHQRLRGSGGATRRRGRGSARQRTRERSGAGACQKRAGRAGNGEAKEAPRSGRSGGGTLYVSGWDTRRLGQRAVLSRALPSAMLSDSESGGGWRACGQSSFATAPRLNGSIYKNSLQQMDCADNEVQGARRTHGPPQRPAAAGSAEENARSALNLTLSVTSPAVRAPQRPSRGHDLQPAVGADDCAK